MNVSILSHGAVGDGTTDCTDAFAEAIHDCALSGGGYVDVPAGRYLSGSIRLLSNVILRLADGSEIIGSEVWSDYSGPSRGCAWSKSLSGIVGELSMPECRALIYSDKAEHTGVIGKGIINGRRSNRHGYSKSKGRPFLIVFSESTDILLQDITLTDPGMFSVYNLNNVRVIIRDIRIISCDSLNGDGIDFDGSRDVEISNCYFETGDDSISIKTLTPGEPCEDIAVSGCTFRSVWAGIRIGPEGTADIRRIRISNCVFENCNDGIKIQSTENTLFEDMEFTDLVMNNVVRPVFITATSFPMSEHSESIRPCPGTIRNLKFKNIVAHMCAHEQKLLLSNNLIYAAPGAVIDNIEMTGIRLSSAGGNNAKSADILTMTELLDYYGYPETLENWNDYPSAIFMLVNSGNIVFRDCRFECRDPDERYAITADRIDGLLIQGSEIVNAKGLLKHVGCKRVKFPRESVVIKTSGNELHLWRKSIKISLDANRYLSSCAAFIDKAQTFTKHSEMTASQDAMKYYANLYTDDDISEVMVYSPSFYGELDLYVNDKPAGGYKLPPRYLFPARWACDITKHLKPGLNTIKLICTFSDKEEKFYPTGRRPGISQPPEIRISTD